MEGPFDSPGGESVILALGRRLEMPMGNVSRLRFNLQGLDFLASCERP